MNPDRRARLAIIGIAVLGAAACFFAADLLPEGGPLGFIASILRFIGTLLAVSLPMSIWKLISPESAARWESSGGRPTPLISPIFFWFATVVFAWLLLAALPRPVTFGDYAGMALLWSAVAGMAAFAVAHTRLYILDHRKTSE